MATVPSANAASTRPLMWLLKSDQKNQGGYLVRAIQRFTSNMSGCGYLGYDLHNSKHGILELDRVKAALPLPDSRVNIDGAAL